MVADHYAQFVDEAFIKPIRSVLIIDDDYPTFEELLADEEMPGKGWRNQRDRVRKVIRSFRKPGLNLLVDIHDGSNVGLREEVAEAEHLHQSDLLVLDYQLDKTKKGDGSIAINIIRKLMSNSHFNMVVVHTSEDLDDVFQSVILALLPHENCELAEGDRVKAEDAIAESEDENAGFQKELEKSISAAQYLKFRQLDPKDVVGLVMKGDAPFSKFADLCKRAKWKPPIQKLVLRYQLAKFAQSILKDEGPAPQQLEWSRDGVKWARSDSVFLAFSSKGMGEAPLQDLSTALNAWRPDPSRLYLARLRHEIDEHGTAAQARVLGNKHALAGWYHGMLKGDASETSWQIAQTITRHSERLMGSVMPNVAKFAERLVDAERKGDPDDICKGHFGIDLKIKGDRLEASSQHNAVVSSKSPEGWHLTTGHVFRFAGGLWICASPACDMVPTQLSGYRKTVYQKRMPFAAVRLQSVPSLENALGKASSSRILFLELDGKIETFSFNELSDDSSAPHWTLLFADELGKLNTDTYEFGIIQVETEGDQLHAKRYPATVVSQLRYEYALNLVQRLGVSMTRIGLDFVGHKAEAPAAQVG